MTEKIGPKGRVSLFLEEEYSLGVFHKELAFQNCVCDYRKMFRITRRDFYGSSFVCRVCGLKFANLKCLVKNVELVRLTRSLYFLITAWFLGLMAWCKGFV